MTAANITRAHRKEHRPEACAPSGHVARLVVALPMYRFVAAECNSAGRTGYQSVFLALLILSFRAQRSAVEESLAILSLNN